MILSMQSRQLEPDITVVELSGRLTLGNSLRDAEDSLRKHLSSGPLTTVLDLSGLEFIDSAGVGMLIICNSTAEAAGGKLFIACPSERVLQSLTLTHVDQVLSIHSSVEQALQS